MRGRRLAVVVAALVFTVCLLGPAIQPGSSPSLPPDVHVEHPNIIFILLDDFSSELVQYMDAFEGLAADGVSFDNYITSNPLCCPSRASILTGMYPHSTGVHDNYWPNGGIGAFLDSGLEQETVGVYLHDEGYRTGFVGKYLNGYRPAGGRGVDGEPLQEPNYVPPGWDEWLATGDAYQGFDYALVASIDGAAHREVHDGDEQDYATDVMASRAETFIASNAHGAQPFALFIDPFATHNNPEPGERPDPDRVNPPMYPPAPRDRADSAGRPASWGAPEYVDGDCGSPDGGGCPGVLFPDSSWGEAHNAKPMGAPAWYDAVNVSTPNRLASLARAHIERVQMAQAADDLIERVLVALASAGDLDQTYVVVGSDNGYHLGQHGLGEGKSTAYDHDVRVPLVVRPPGGVAGGYHSAQLVQNVDLLPTFLELAGAEVPSDVDGQSFATSISTQAPESGRTSALVEFWRDERFLAGADPDREAALATIPPSFRALRTLDYLYIDYSTEDDVAPGPRTAEFYDLGSDPYQTENVFGELSAAQQDDLNMALMEYGRCAGPSCHEAASFAPPIDVGAETS